MEISKKRLNDLERKARKYEKIIRQRASILNEFKKFIEEYKVLGLAIAFVMGAAANTLVKSFVDNIIMPLINPFLTSGKWQTATFSIGSITIGWGAFLSAFLNFLIIALVIFIIVRKIFKKKI
jgi:large conductance mechanosensitive channel